MIRRRGHFDVRLAPSRSAPSSPFLCVFLRFVLFLILSDSCQMVNGSMLEAERIGAFSRFFAINETRTENLPACSDFCFSGH